MMIFSVVYRRNIVLQNLILILIFYHNVVAFPNCIRNDRNQLTLFFDSSLNQSELVEKYSIMEKKIIKSSPICCLNIEIQYELQMNSVSFNFGTVDKTEKSEMNKIQLLTTLIKGEEIVESTFRLSCTIDFCTEYYFNTSILNGQLNWLFDSKISPVKLQVPLEKLLFNADEYDELDSDQSKSLKCYIDDQSEMLSECFDDICSIHAKGIETSLFNCGYLSSQFQLLEIQLIFGIITLKEKTFFTETLYNCEKSKCNGFETLEKVENLIEKYYNVYDLIEWPILSSDETTTTTLITTTTKVTRTTGISTETLTTTPNWISTNILIDQTSTNHRSTNIGLCLRAYLTLNSLLVYLLFFLASM